MDNTQQPEIIKKKHPGARRSPGMVDRPRRVAQRVKQLIAEGKKVVLAEIMREEGYAETVAMKPRNVTDRPSYKEEMGDFLERIQRHRDRVIDAMEKKNLNEEQYRSLSDSLTKLTHDVQLLSGGKTENVGLEEDRKTLTAIIAQIKNG